MDIYADKVLKPRVTQINKSLKEEDHMMAMQNNQLNKHYWDFDQTKKKNLEDHYKDIGAQVRQSTLKKSIDKSLFENDKIDMQQKVANTLDYESMVKQEKAKKQQMYKDILNYQCQLNKKLKTQGGMTKTEKQMNKQQLHAYRNFENASFSMIPGLNDASKISYYRTPAQLVQNYSSPDFEYSQRGFSELRNIYSRNSVNDNLGKIIKAQQNRNYSQEKLNPKPLMNDYTDGSMLNGRPNLTKDGMKNLKSRNMSKDILQNTAGEVMRKSNNNTPNGSPNRGYF